MSRFLATLLTSALMALGAVAATAGPAHAADSPWCGSTSFSASSGGEFPVLTWVSYVGSGSALPFGSSYRVWHVTDYYGGAYRTAYGMKCQSGQVLTTTSLWRDALTMGMRCGTTNFSEISPPSTVTRFVHLGFRASSGHKYYYWHQLIDGGQFVGYGITAAKCL